MDAFWWSLAVSTAVVFVAELGDKSQLMALAFATRYRPWPVLLGITIATSAVHLLSVAVGHAVGGALPTGWIGAVSAVAFIGFGAWTLRGDRLTEGEQARARNATGSAILVTSVAFFLAELGDKTMLATITLATQHGWLAVWIGSTVGMVAADGLAILVGRRLGRRLPERAVRIGAAVLFLAGGLWLADDALAQLTGTSVSGAAAQLIDHHSAAWLALGLTMAAALLTAVGRVGAGGSPAVDGRSRRPGRLRRAMGTPAGWARVLFVASTGLGLLAPLLVAMDVAQPVALLARPGVVVVGVGLSLLGTALVLAARSQQMASGGGARLFSGRGLHAHMRHPGLTGMVVATAGTMLMVPTLLAVLAALLLVVAVQIQVRAVREPQLADRHGNRYAAYAARTGRFLPGVGRIDHAATRPAAHRMRVG